MATTQTYLSSVVGAAVAGEVEHSQAV